MSPTYTYECSAGHIEEHTSSISTSPLTRCLRTGCKRKAKRVILSPPRVAWGPERISMKGIDRTPPTKVYQTDKRKKRAQ